MQTEYAKPRAVGSLSAHAVGEFAGHECRQATSYTAVRGLVPILAPTLATNPFLRTYIRFSIDTRER